MPVGWLVDELVNLELLQLGALASLFLPFVCYLRFFVPFATCLTDMERNGIAVDVEHLARCLSVRTRVHAHALAHTCNPCDPCR